MKKIMFSHKWGLHQAAITGEKPTTLRIIPKRIIEACKDPANPFDYPNREKLIQAAPYQVGDVVAIAEPYKDIFSPLDWANREIYRNEYGWDNKMYVQATLMNHFALIKEVTAREAQTLTYEELLEDGLGIWADPGDWPIDWYRRSGFKNRGGNPEATQDLYLEKPLKTQK